MKRENLAMFFLRIRAMTLVFVLMSLGLLAHRVLADVSVPQVDQTPIGPLSSLPASADPRYLSGIGLDNAYTIFYEDRSDTVGCAYGARIYLVNTLDGPMNFSAPIQTNICDTHFVVKDFPITIGAITYAYRGWGAIGNNEQHNFYVSNDMVNWVRNPIAPNLTFTFADPNGTGLHVYYGFHDVIELNGNYMGFAETNTGDTVIVWSNDGSNIWDIVAVVGGTGENPLDLDVGGAGPTPTGNFVLMEVNGQEVYGKLSVPGNDSGAYLAINRAAVVASTSASAEAAFLNPANWTWSDGSIGIPDADSRILTEIANHDVREVWTVPISNSLSDHVILYTARYGAGSDLGCAASTTDCSVVSPSTTSVVTTDDFSFALPQTGFAHGKPTVIDFQIASKAYTATNLILKIPALTVEMPIVGVSHDSVGWNVTWLADKAGYLEGSAFPTWAGNTVLTGHVWDFLDQPGPFAALKTLQYGDLITIEAWGETFVYEVRESQLVTAQNMDAVFQSEDYDWVTLLTCEVYNPLGGDYLFRRMVRAVLVDVVK